MKLGEGKLPSAKTKEQTCLDTDVIEIPHDMFRESNDEVIEEILKTLRLILETGNIFNQECSLLLQTKLSMK